MAYSAPTAPAAEVRFSNWIVSGNLHLKKLNQDVVLPRGSAFNGVEAHCPTAVEPGQWAVPDLGAPDAAAPPLRRPPDFVNGFTFRGTTTIPALTRCGLSTPLLTLFMSGPDNRFSITIKPPPAG